MSAARPVPTVSAGLLLLRIAVGGVMFAHGWQKIMDGIPATQEGFAAMGVPAAELAAIVVIFVELIGGALLVLGLFTRIVGVLLAIDMAVAAVLVHGGTFWAADGGWEFVGLLSAGGLALALTGAGAFGLDAVLFRGRRRR